jgi:hypothetical protein
MYLHADSTVFSSKSKSTSVKEPGIGRSLKPAD